jgi:hypothetical protein
LVSRCSLSSKPGGAKHPHHAVRDGLLIYVVPFRKRVVGTVDIVGFRSSYGARSAWCTVMTLPTILKGGSIGL